MRRPIKVRRLLVVLGVVVALAAVPVVVFAANGVFGGALERQSARWTTTSVTTSRTAWRNVPGLGLTRCTLNQVTATASVTVRGAPVLLRMVIDGVPEAPMRPGAARFVPDGIESFSFTWVGRTAPFEADDTHRFNLQWRSPTGQPVTLQRGVLNLLFQRGRQGCP
jgi:hypothetical protein